MQQVWSFGATDAWPGNVVGDDGWVGGVGVGIGVGDWDWEGVGRGDGGEERVQGRGRGLMVVNGDGDEGESEENRYQRMAGVVDRKHRSLVQSLVGLPSASPPRHRSGGGGGVDVKALRQMERNLSALGF